MRRIEVDERGQETSALDCRADWSAKGLGGDLFSKPRRQVIEEYRRSQTHHINMADVRSMLRNERVSRRLTHPHLAYSTTNTLVCLVCHIQLKSENLWNKHLLSAQHAMRLQRIRDNVLGRPPGAPPPPRDPEDELPEARNGSKKRKADDSDDDARKKTKPANHTTEHYFEDENEYNAHHHLTDSEEDEAMNGVEEDNAPKSQTTDPNPVPTPPTTIENGTVDEDEWAAFERDVATPPPEPSALTAEATISAAPMSAAELAAQSREQASLQRKTLREAELEGEKEDAARQMEDEFDEMAESEERVRRLREKRERLRVAKAESKVDNNKDAESDRDGEGDDEKDDDDDSDEADEWDLWAR